MSYDEVRGKGEGVGFATVSAGPTAPDELRTLAHGYAALDRRLERLVRQSGLSRGRPPPPGTELWAWLRLGDHIDRVRRRMGRKIT